MNLTDVKICIVNTYHTFKISFNQVGFIDAICLPIYNSFSVYSDNRLQPLLDGCLENKKQWLKLAENDKFDAWDNDDTTEGDGGC